MPKKKVKLAFVMDAAARKATYKKRTKSLLKKVGEVSALCGIEACAIILSPYDSEPKVWPNPLGVQRVVAMFNRKNKKEQTSKMFNQETFLRQMNSKLKRQFINQQTETCDKDITLLMFELLTCREGLQNLTLQDLNALCWKIEQKLSEVNARMETINMASETAIGNDTSPPASFKG
ncbi:hypothetical protein M9H77_19781 [Catharanthus roseus]|uniref:Uncharacterized protein n=1 Tax=Catharanthus roseus TaxID=4058 RepID=A0ACC0BBD6_CATRO|nr:hypothetical protein M9H77_19781 [Catharanthus roseus]